jgi:hypothetical protein
VGEIVLQLEDVVERDLRRPRPEQPAARRLDKLCGHAHFAAGTEKRPGHRRVDIELGGKRRQIGRVGLEAGGGQARSHDQGRETAERRGDRVGETERQEIDLGIGPQHPEGEHNQARHCARDRRDAGVTQISGGT